MICDAPLASHLFKTYVELVPRMAVGVTGIWGWGLLFEWCRSRKELSFCHAFIGGTVIVASLRLLTSLGGGVHSSWPIAIAGTLLTLLVLGDLRRRKIRIWSFPALSRGEKGGLFFLLALAGLYGLLLLSPPVSQSDQTSIWSYHAKALCCESLWHADYINEPFWTGTHPEYPLYQPFLHSYFFSLNDSFRDDVVKIWQAITVLLMAPLLFWGLKSSLPGPGFRMLVVVSLYFFWQNQGRDAPPELCAAIFSSLLTLAVLNREWSRLPLYVLGLVTTKNESLIFGILFLGGVTLLARDSKGEKKPIVRAEIASGILVLLWLAVAVKLPSRHEQYLSRAFDPSAWRMGFSGLPVILKGYIKTLLGFPYLYVVLAVFLSAFTRAQRGSRSFQILMFWPAGMLLVFLLIYIISPWGPSLYAITLTRLLFPVVCPWLLVSAICLWSFERIRPVLVVAWVLIYFNAALMHHWAFLGNHKLHNTSVRDYPALLWQWDQKIPPRARVAWLNSEDFFTSNYLMYPRKIYTSPPDQIQGTGGNLKWTQRSQVDVDRYRIDIIVDDGKVIWRRE